MTVPTQNLLPLPSLQFLDANGLPLAMGLVYTYDADGLTPKDTDRDPDGQVLNSNPIDLDAAGRALIYGRGEYIWRVMDSLGNVQYTEPTADPTDILQISDVIWPFLRASTTEAALAAIGGAPIDSPDFTGNPTAPTPATGNNSTAIATTAFVDTAISTLAPIDSPHFTGVPTAPTAAAGTDTDQIATTAFVHDALAGGGAIFATITDQKANRAIGTNYTNSGSTPRYLMVSVSAPFAPGAYLTAVTVTVGTFTFDMAVAMPAGTAETWQFALVIPPGATYSVSALGFGGSGIVNANITTWYEIQ
jgi:hypothetical protein